MSPSRVNRPAGYVPPAVTPLGWVEVVLGSGLWRRRFDGPNIRYFFRD